MKGSRTCPGELRVPCCIHCRPHKRRRRSWLFPPPLVHSPRVAYHLRGIFKKRKRDQWCSDGNERGRVKATRSGIVVSTLERSCVVVGAPIGAIGASARAGSATVSPRRVLRTRVRATASAIVREAPRPAPNRAHTTRHMRVRRRSP